MARANKPVQLRPVDEGVQPAPVIRLKNRETEHLQKDNDPIRLGAPLGGSEVSQRLDLPTREEVELRTHQPGIETIIATEATNPDHLEQKWGVNASPRYPIPWGWFALIGLTISGAVLWSLTRIEKAEVQADRIRVATASALSKEQQEEQEARQLIERINKTLMDYYNATSVEALALLVRHPERVVPLMRRYYADHPVFSSRLNIVSSLTPLTLQDRANFWIASVVLADGKKRQLIIEILESGAVRVDWETLVCYQPMKWDDYVAQRPAVTPLDFRVYVEPDHYFNHEFSDAKQWTCFRLSALDSEQTLFGYAPTGSAIGRALLRQLRLNGERKFPLMLRLSIPQGLQSPSGVVIEKILGYHWLYVDPPDADS